MTKNNRMKLFKLLCVNIINIKQVYIEQILIDNQIS